MILRQMLTAIALVLSSSVAFAGLVQPQPVQIDLVNNTAMGDMVTARFSDNDVEFIGCGVRYIDDMAGSAVAFAFCQAADADGEQLFCSTLNTDLIVAIQSIADFSFISFAADDNGDCTRIGNSTQSFYIPGGVEDNDFENHTHEYLTGEGVGHNNTPATTSPPSEEE